MSNFDFFEISCIRTLQTYKFVNKLWTQGMLIHIYGENSTICHDNNISLSWFE